MVSGHNGIKIALIYANQKEQEPHIHIVSGFTFNKLCRKLKQN